MAAFLLHLASVAGRLMIVVRRQDEPSQKMLLLKQLQRKEINSEVVKFLVEII
jgi:hypothetical protein